MAHSVDLSQEVTLPTDVDERVMHDNLANLFSIVVAADALERAFNNGDLPADKYAARHGPLQRGTLRADRARARARSVRRTRHQAACEDLRKQYRSALTFVKSRVPDLATFMRSLDVRTRRRDAAAG